MGPSRVPGLSTESLFGSVYPHTVQRKLTFIGLFLNARLTCVELHCSALQMLLICKGRPDTTTPGFREENQGPPSSLLGPAGCLSESGLYSSKRVGSLPGILPKSVDVGNTGKGGRGFRRIGCRRYHEPKKTPISAAIGRAVSTRPVVTDMGRGRLTSSQVLRNSSVRITPLGGMCNTHATGCPARRRVRITKTVGVSPLNCEKLRPCLVGLCL